MPSDQLPDDIAELKRLLLAKDAELSAASSELAAAKNGLVITQLTIEKLKAQIAKFRREKFGASSERVDRALEQLELALEEAEAAKAEAVASQPQEPEAPMPVPAGSAPTESEPATKKKRRQLPPEFPRRDVVHRPPAVCKRCGGTDLRDVSESVTEVLRYVPGHFEVDRHVRPACSCRKCEAMMQAPMPELPIPRGMVDASFLGHIVISKFCDHIPLYRLAEICARRRLEIDRGQLAEWLGHVAWLLAPLVELIAAHIMAGHVLHCDDTPVPVLAPGRGKTKTGRLWVHVGDHNHRFTVYDYTPDHSGDGPQRAGEPAVAGAKGVHGRGRGRSERRCRTSTPRTMKTTCSARLVAWSATRSTYLAADATAWPAGISSGCARIHAKTPRSTRP